MLEATVAGLAVASTAAAAKSPSPPDWPLPHTLPLELSRSKRQLLPFLLLPFQWLRHTRRLLAIFLLLLLILCAALVGRRIWAQHELQVGRALLERYHQDEARPHLEACLRLSPDNAEVLLLLARAARRASVLDMADHYLEEYQRLHGPTEELALEQILQAAAKGEVDRVGKYCKDLVKQDSPAAPLALEAMIQGYFQTYRLGEGHGALQVWLEREPDNTQALVFEAGLKAMLLHFDEAGDIYKRILELDPEHYTARLRLATLLMEKLKHAEAVPHLEYLRKRYPDNPMVAVLLAKCRFQLGRQAEAEQLLEEVLVRFPQFAPALAERGRLALARGDTDRAESWIQEALAQEPSNYHMLYQLSQCLSQSGRTADADVLFRRLEKLNLNAKRLEKITTEEMQQRPHDPALQHELALLMMDQGQAEEALKWLDRALKEDPSYPPAHQALADFYQQGGDAERAAYHRQFLARARPVNNP
jgi:predicted Zn-dependent protease